MQLTNTLADQFIDDEYQCRGYLLASEFIFKLRGNQKNLNDKEWQELRETIAYALDFKLI